MNTARQTKPKCLLCGHKFNPSSRVPISEQIDRHNERKHIDHLLDVHEVLSLQTPDQQQDAL